LQPGQYQSGSSIYLMPSNYDSTTFVDSAQTIPYTYAMGNDAGPITNVYGVYEINKQFNSPMGGQTIWGLQLGPPSRSQPGQHDVIVVRQDGRTYWNMQSTAGVSYFSTEGSAVMYWNASGDLYSLGNGTATFGAFALTGASGGISSSGVFSGNGSGLTNINAAHINGYFQGVCGATNGFASWSTNQLAPGYAAGWTNLGTVGGITNRMYANVIGTSGSIVYWGRTGANGVTPCGFPIFTNTVSVVGQVIPVGVNCGIQINSGVGVTITPYSQGE
jgi:hypothetical protein